jgi:hypothetical protein
VVVAVIAVRVVEMASDSVIHVVAMRHRLVATARTMHMARLMPTAAMVGSAGVGILARYLDHMLVDMIFVRMVEVTIVQIVDVAAVTHGGVSTAGPMHDRHESGQSKSSWDRILSVFKIRGHRGAALCRVVDGVADQRQHVLVGESVEDVLGFAPPPDQTNDEQRLQSRRHSGDLLALVFGQLRHARFALGKPQ